MRVAFAVALAACAAPKPEPLETPTPLPAPRLVSALGADAPRIDTLQYAPDVSEFGRWPLTVAEHPELEPHFAIADALAQPGITWQQLCTRGAQQRVMGQNADYGEYLAAWCSVAKDDSHDALYRLGNLHRSLRLRDAIELDVAAITVSGLDPRIVEGELRRANLLELRIVDRVAAAFFEVGKLDGATDLNRLAMAMDRAPTEETACARRMRSIADGGEGAHTEIEILAHLPEKHGRGRCLDLAEDVLCWSGKRCTSASFSARQRDGLASLVRARTAWPRGEADAGVWVRIASQAAEGWPYDQAMKVAMPALQIALRTSLCRGEYLEAISSIAARLGAASDLDTASPGEAPALIATYKPRLDEITSHVKTLPRNDRVACSAQLAALPPVVTP